MGRFCRIRHGSSDVSISVVFDSRNQEARFWTYIREFIQTPLMVFARVMTGEVGRCDIRDRLGIDPNNLSECKPKTCLMRTQRTDLPPIKLSL